MNAPLDDHVSPVLDVLVFPVERWQIVTAAEEYGADLRTRQALRGLTNRTYFSREMLLREIAEHERAGTRRPAMRWEDVATHRGQSV